MHACMQYHVADRGHGHSDGTSVVAFYVDYGKLASNFLSRSASLNHMADPFSPFPVGTNAECDDLSVEIVSGEAASSSKGASLSAHASSSLSPSSQPFVIARSPSALTQLGCVVAI